MEESLSFPCKLLDVSKSSMLSLFRLTVDWIWQIDLYVMMRFTLVYVHISYLSCCYMIILCRNIIVYKQ